MATEKKEPKERKIISASEAKQSKPKAAKAAKPVKSAPVEEAVETVEAESPAPEKKIKEAKHAPEGSTPKGRATGKRVGAVILWVVAVAFEVLAILIINKTIAFPPADQAVGLLQNSTAWLLAAIVLDLICVVIGSQLWKKANHIDPASEKNKVKFFLWNNMGVIVSVIAFLPFIILLLTNKETDGKQKKIAAIAAVVALLIAGFSSFDYNPISKEQLESQNTLAAETAVDQVYWTTFGKVYHYDQDCQALTNSATLIQGSVDEAIEANRTRLCKFCAKNHDIDLTNGAVEDVRGAELAELEPAA